MLVATLFIFLVEGVLSVQKELTPAGGTTPRRKSLQSSATWWPLANICEKHKQCLLSSLGKNEQTLNHKVLRGGNTLKALVNKQNAVSKKTTLRKIIQMNEKSLQS